MQTVHVSAYMIRNLRGSYVKSENDEGVGYVMFRSQAKAKEWVKQHGESCYVVAVRTAITPTNTSRTERMVAVREAQSKTLSAKRKVEHNFYP